MEEVLFEGLTPDLVADPGMSVLFALPPKLKGGNPHRLEPTGLKGFFGGSSAFSLFRSHTRSCICPTLTWCRISHHLTESPHWSELETALNEILAATGALLWKYSSL